MNIIILLTTLLHLSNSSISTNICEPHKPDQQLSILKKEITEIPIDGQWDYASSEEQLTQLEAEVACRTENYKLWSPLPNEDPFKLLRKLTLFKVGDPLVWTDIRYIEARKSTLTETTWNNRVTFELNDTVIGNDDLLSMPETDCVVIQKTPGRRILQYKNKNCQTKLPFICYRPTTKSCKSFVKKVKEISKHPGIPTLALSTLSNLMNNKAPDYKNIIITALEILYNQIFQKKEPTTRPPVTTQTPPTTQITTTETLDHSGIDPTEEQTETSTNSQIPPPLNTNQLRKLKGKIRRIEQQFLNIQNYTESLKKNALICSTCYYFNNHILLSLIIAILLYASLIALIIVHKCSNNERYAAVSQFSAQERYNPSAPPRSSNDSQENIPLRALPSPPTERPAKYRVQKLTKQAKAL